jgi:AcrR family transcriptional regulator
LSTPELDRLSAAQQHLLTAATDAFADLGFGGTSTRDIAARASRSPAAVYVHHDSKEELLFAISTRGHDSALACLREATAAHRDPIECLRVMVFAFSLWHMDNAKLGRVVQYEFHALTQQHRETIAALRREMVRLMSSAIREGVAVGVFETTDLSLTADAVLSLSIDLARWFDPERKRDKQAIAQHHADLAVRMLQPSAPRHRLSERTHG